MFNTRLQGLIKQLHHIQLKPKKSPFSLFYHRFKNKLNFFSKTHKNKKFIFYNQKYMLSLLKIYLQLIKVNKNLKFKSITQSLLQSQTYQEWGVLNKLFSFFLQQHYNFSPLKKSNFKQQRFYNQLRDLHLRG